MLTKDDPRKQMNENEHKGEFSVVFLGVGATQKIAQLTLPRAATVRLVAQQLLHTDTQNIGNNIFYLCFFFWYIFLGAKSFHCQHNVYYPF